MIIDLNFESLQKTKKVIFLSLFIYGLVLILNDGFMALDEYFVGITRYIPAQTSTVVNLVGTDDVKSPLQLMPMHFVAQGALALGIDQPYWQYRTVIAALGIINILLLLLAFHHFAKTEKFNDDQYSCLILLFTFYFAAPFALTRPMFETMAAPWLLWAAVFAYRYDQKPELKDALWGVFCASMAFVLRQQVGFCALVFMILPLIKKNYKHLFYVAGLGLVFFILSGIPDYYLRGQFHFSLLNLTIYNFKHGAEYGQQSVLFYPALIIAMCFTPFLIKKYPSGFAKEQLWRFKSIWLILFLFVFLHSLFPQKWERFLITVIPILMILIFPFLYYFHLNFKANKLRIISLYSLNFLLFIVASFFPAQKNLIEMSRYLDGHDEIKKVYRVADTPGWITDAFIRNKQYNYVESDLSILSQVDWKNCSNNFVVGEAQYEEFRTISDKLNLKAEFNVNLIEQLAFKLNPSKNLRRVKLRLLSGC